MITLVSIVVLGFFLGMRHATDPDHVVAVATIVSREKSIRHATTIGALWGVGHTLTILVVGAAILLFKLTIPPRLGLSMELSVAFMLILLGALNLTGVMSRAMGWFSSHGYDAGAHVHRIAGRWMLHTHGRADEPIRGDGESFVHWCRMTWRKLGAFHVLRPLVVGVVHGLAGSAAVALLVLATIPAPRWEIAYLLVFGLGTIAGMMLITAAIALPFAYTIQHFTQLNRTLTLASGLLSVSFGLFLCYQIGIINGLFIGHANWTPR